MNLLFTSIYKHLIKNRMFWCILLFAITIGLCYLASTISLREDIMEFLPKNKQNKDVSFVINNMKSQNKIVFAIYAKNDTLPLSLDESIDIAEELVTTLDTIGHEFIDNILYYIDQSQITATSTFVAQNIPLFFDSLAQAKLAQLNDSSSQAALRQDKYLLASPMGNMLQSYILNDPFSLTASALDQLKEMDSSHTYQLLDGYLFTADQTKQMVILELKSSATQTAQNNDIKEKIERSIIHIENNYPQAKIAVTGSALIAVTNANQIKTDSIIAIIIALFAILILLWYSLRSIKAMLFIALPVLFGALFSVAIIALFQGTISAIALGTSSIILGIAVNYSIHFVAHYQHTGSILDTIADVSSPMITGCLSAVGAFMTLLFINADAMRDFGLFASLSLIGALLFVLIVLPLLLTQSKLKTDTHIAFFSISNYPIEKNKIIVSIFFILTMLFAFLAPKVTFDTNLHKINYMTQTQRADLEIINSHQGNTTDIIVAVFGDNTDEALTNHYNTTSALKNLVEQNAIVSIKSIGELIPTIEQQEQRVSSWNTYWQEADSQQFVSNLLLYAANEGIRTELLSPFISQLSTVAKVQNLDYFKTLPFLSDFLIETPHKSAIISNIIVDVDQYDYVVNNLNSVPNTIAFNPVAVNKSMMGSLKESLTWVLYVCIIIVFIVLWIAFRRIELTLAAFLPILISWIWILGIMALFNIHFNIINIILITFIFGLGDDFGIFITQGKMHEYAYNSRITTSYKSAIILAALTTFFGVGTLLVAKHPAMYSLAQVTIIGMVSVVLISYLIPPVIFNALVLKKGKKRLTPVTLQYLFKTWYAFFVFILGSIYLSIAGFILLTLKRDSDKNKYKFHVLLCKTLRAVERKLPKVRSLVLNPHVENFQKPAVIIANHQSHLDLMYILMLSPKLIILTNNWVWHSPFYGGIIRYADFYPVAQGIENSIPKLAQMVEKGYSIVVFPEGTRSVTGDIARFHKGAFMLAHQLNLDILPITLLGVNQILPKTEFLLRPGAVTIHIGKRSTLKTNQYSQEAKEMRRIMIDQYTRMQQQYQDFDYYKSDVMGNYIYKGYQYEKQAKQILNNPKIKDFVNTCTFSGKILFINAGIGVIPLMVALTHKHIQVYATEKEAQSLCLAANCHSKPDNLHYIESQDNLTDFDTIIDINLLTASTN